MFIKEKYCLVKLNYINLNGFKLNCGKDIHSRTGCGVLTAASFDCFETDKIRGYYGF